MRKRIQGLCLQQSQPGRSQNWNPGTSASSLSPLPLNSPDHHEFLWILEKQHIAGHITTLSPSKEEEPPVASGLALHFLSLSGGRAGQRGLYPPAPVGGAWPGSPCCVRDSSIIAKRVFKHYQLCPVLPTFPFVLKVDPDTFPISNSVGPLQSDSGLNSSIYDKIFPHAPFFLAQPQKPKTKKANDLSCSETSCVHPKAASLWTRCGPAFASHM